jgi:hypothetical protein
MALWSTQPLTEMSTRSLPGGKGRSARKADKLTTICEPIIYKMWDPRRLTTLWASTTCCRDSVMFLLTSVEISLLSMLNIMCKPQSVSLPEIEVNISAPKRHFTVTRG